MSEKEKSVKCECVKCECEPCECGAETESCKCCCG